MLKNAIELRTLVTNNAFTMGRIKKDDVGDADYKEMTALYTDALDALTNWAAKDYVHKSTKEDADDVWATMKPILALFETKEERIIIDEVSMRTMRDLATKPKRQYSPEYRKAHTALLNAKKTVTERYNDLIALGAPAIEENETVGDYVNRIHELGTNTINNDVDMLKMYEAANSVLTVKEKAENDIKDGGNWSWKRPVAVSVNEFAELFENYIADCLIDGYNIKTSKVVRDEQAEARRARAEAKKNA